MEKSCVKGTNIITSSKISNQGLSLQHDSKKLFNIDFNKVSKVSSVRNDLILEMSSKDVPKAGLSLAQVRFHVPNQQLPAKPSSAELLQRRLQKHIKLDQNLQQKFFEFQGLSFLVPRGKYDLTIYLDTFQLHGCTYSYSIHYGNISKCFLLPMTDNMNLVFVIGYKKPIVQGKTHYNYMLIQLSLNRHATVDALATLDKLRAVNQSLMETYTGPLYEAFTSVFGLISENDIVLPSSSFRSHKDTNGVECTVKANRGILFMMRKSIMYIYKPSIYHFKYSEILLVRLHRVDVLSKSKSFDMEIFSKSGQQVLFSNIMMAETKNLIKILKSKKVKLEKPKEEDNISDQEYTEQLEDLVQSNVSGLVNDKFLGNDAESSQDTDYKPRKMKRKNDDSDEDEY